MTLATDAVFTLVAAVALAGIGALVPAFVDDYDMPVGRQLAEAAYLFGGSLLLVVSLITTTLLIRGGSQRRRRAGLVAAGVRLASLAAVAVAFVAYGTVAHGA
ncbi:hypothetical protein [Streptomyces sp. cmx-18-6]|uniref:hypothetical protein n=1 Tax=Streptomyces sp. cmx-18-6 TaxID=2790930 RepID=UPI00398119F2